MDPIEVAARLGCSPEALGRLIADRDLDLVHTDAGPAISRSAFDQFTDDPRLARLRLQAVELALKAAAAEEQQLERSTAMEREAAEHTEALRSLVSWARDVELPTEHLAVCRIGIAPGTLRRRGAVGKVSGAWVVEGWHVGRAVHREFDLVLERELFLSADAVLIAGCRPIDRSVLRRLPSVHRRGVRMQVTESRLHSPTNMDLPANFDALAAWVSRAIGSSSRGG